jgi:hypothetical protein
MAKKKPVIVSEDNYHSNNPSRIEVETKPTTSSPAPLPAKFSYDRKDVTLVAKLATPRPLPHRLEVGTVNFLSSIVGIVPFDWEYEDGACEVWFGLDSVESAQAVKRRLAAVGVNHVDYFTTKEMMAHSLKLARQEGMELIFVEDFKGYIMNLAFEAPPCDFVVPNLPHKVVADAVTSMLAPTSQSSGEFQCEWEAELRKKRRSGTSLGKIRCHTLNPDGHLKTEILDLDTLLQRYDENGAALSGSLH